MNSGSLQVCFPVKADAVGFVGLGNMGSYMAQNLLKKGYQVIAYDLSADAVKVIVDAGEWNIAICRCFTMFTDVCMHAPIRIHVHHVYKHIIGPESH